MDMMRGFRLLLLGVVLFAGVPAARAEQEKQPQTGFALVGVVDGAEVYVDGDKIGTTPLSPVTFVPSGEHTIRVVRPGFTPYVDVFKVREGRTTKFPVELVPFSGVLRVASKLDKTRVFIDGRFIGETPVETEVKIGPHSVKVSRFGYRDNLFSISSVAGEVLEKEAQLSELPAGENPYRQSAAVAPRWYERWWVWTLGATGVAAVAVAVIVPTVYASRDSCQRLNAELCISVPSAASVKTLQIGGRF